MAFCRIVVRDTLFQKLNTTNSAQLEISNEIKKKDESLNAKDKEISSLTTKIKEFETLTASKQVTMRVCKFIF